MSDQKTVLVPVASNERFVSLDVLRGFAVLGILIMNIQNFAMIEAAYLNPTAYGDLTGLNKLIWIFSHIFADQKFMTLFSILFGAGIILFTDRAESKGLKPIGLHYRRIFWLFVIGMIHAYVFWQGDILVSYALCAIVVVWFRKISPRALLILGIISVAVSSGIYILSGSSIQHWPQESINGMMATWKPSAEQVAKEIAAMRGGFTEQFTVRIPSSLKFQTLIFFIWTGWRAGGLMLIGMALYKWGILAAQKTKQQYKIWMIAGFATGLIFIIWGLVKHFENDWVLEYSMFTGSQFNYWGSLFIAAGYLGLIMLILKSGILKKLMVSLSAVGRMAFSNYLLQTLICTTVFYGHGFGLFGQVERFGQIFIVIAVSLLQLVISPIWLSYFHFGPMEWLWRSLTYWKRQPMRRA